MEGMKSPTSSWHLRDEDPKLYPRLPLHYATSDPRAQHGDGAKREFEKLVRVQYQRVRYFNSVGDSVRFQQLP